MMPNFKRARPSPFNHSSFLEAPPTSSSASESPSSASSALRELPQPGMNGLLGLNQDVDQVLGLVGAARGEERVRSAAGALNDEMTTKNQISLNFTYVY